MRTTLRRPAPAGRRQGGFSLVNVMLLLAGIAIVSVLQFRDQAFRFNTQRAVHAGQQMRLLNDAVEGYLAAHAQSLAGMQDNECFGVAGCAPATDKWYCLPIGSGGNQCDLSLPRLVVEGFLPPNWQNVNSWGSNYKVVVTRVVKPNATATGNPMDYNLRAVAVTQVPWADANGTLMLGLLGQAVKAGGADMAMTSTDANRAQGMVRRTYNAALNGGTLVTWNAGNDMNPWINGVGLLVARAGFESSTNAAFPDLLRRDGSRAMRNNFNIGANRINNVQDAFLKNISGGRNLAAVSPTWVFKYSWRVASDGATIQKPDCRVESGGWTTRTSLSNPWDPLYSASGQKTYDEGIPRILVVNDTLKNLKALGYYRDADPSLCTDPATGEGRTSSSAPGTSSCPANDPYVAYDPALRARARAAYAFYATDLGASWQVNMRYYQNNGTNTDADATNSEGIASVYCYYDRQATTGCNGEAGCAENGTTRAAGSAALSDLSAPPIATTSAPYQPPSTTGTSSELPPGTGAPGAGDVTVTF